MELKQNKVPLIGISKTVSTKIDAARCIISIYNILNDIKISDTEVTVLAYFILYGINRDTKQLIIRSEICKNINVIKGILTKLKKNNLIYKDDLNGKVYVNPALNINISPITAMYIKLNISN